MKRQDIIDRFKTNPEVSVLIIGAGVNGIGTFRDLAMQEVDVLIIDRGDYCSGASAASSHMVHGGIRYLENGEFRLVREAVQERNRLLENAPHLVDPLPTVIPIFKWFSGLLNAPLKFLGLLNKPSERGAIIIKLGMIMYDLYTRAQATVPRHQFASRKDTLDKFPKLNPKLIFSGTYYDAAMPSPERICIEMIEDTRATTPEAWAINYVKPIKAGGDEVILKDEISGSDFKVKPKIIINAAGPWIDIVNQGLGEPSQFIGGTKGSHLVLDHPELRQAIGDHEIFFENKDGRIVVIYPLKDKVMIGSSDIRIDEPDSARCTEEEIDYFFEMVKTVFPAIQLDHDQIVYRFSGVRPLPYSRESTTGQISRDHSIKIIEAGNGLNFPVYSLVGGKWTTNRAFAEQATDKICEFLGVERKRDTRALPIGGGKNYPQSREEKDNFIAQISDDQGIDPIRARTLFERYGVNSKSFAQYISLKEDHPLRAHKDYSEREIAYLVENDDVLHLDDLILRRTMMAKLGQLSRDLLDELSEIIGENLDWDTERRKFEVNRTTQILHDKHGVTL